MELLIVHFLQFSKTQETHNSDFDSPSSSPRSYRTTSPCSSRSMSPICSNLIANDDDENYSPACSDDDDDDDDVKNAAVNKESSEYRISLNRAQPSNVMDIMKLIEEGTEAIDDTLSDKEDLDELSSDVPPKLAQMRNQAGDTIDIIENLLYRITLMINKRPELGKPETLDTLIRAINLFGANNNFANALTNILLYVVLTSLTSIPAKLTCLILFSESQFFAQIIKHGVVHQLYQLTKLDEVDTDYISYCIFCLITFYTVADAQGRIRLSRDAHERGGIELWQGGARASAAL